MNSLLRSHLSERHHVTMLEGSDCIHVRVVRWTFIAEKSGPFYTVDSTVKFVGVTNKVAAERYFQYEASLRS